MFYNNEIILIISVVGILIFLIIIMLFYHFCIKTQNKEEKQIHQINEMLLEDPENQIRSSSILTEEV